MSFVFKIILTFAVACAAEAFGASQLQLEVSNLTWRGGANGYDVFDAVEHAETVQVRVHLTGDPCAFFVGVGTESGQDDLHAVFGVDQLELRILDSLNGRIPLKDTPGATEGEVLSGVFLAGETVKTLNFVVVIPPEQIKPAGLYTGGIRVTAYEGTPASFAPRDTRTITISVPLAEVTELSLVSPGSSFNPNAKGQLLEFDTLAAGKVRDLDMRIRSNAGYRVSMHSENGGVMKNLAAGINTTIPYTVQVTGQTFSLGESATEILSGANQLTTPQGEQHPMSVTIGDASGAAAGSYRDVIIVTVISDN